VPAIALVDADATRRAGAVLGALVEGGDAIALIGDLGAGKTTLVGGLVAALGGGDASSPTFALVHEYPGGRLVTWHVDLYRVEHARELIELGLDDVLGDRRGVCVIEWADKLAVMPPDHLRVELSHAGAQRALTLAGTGPRGRALASAAIAELLQPRP
jgi:tRNA threonylcarbamoyladenosine biosynthesis protein TsaE